MKKSILVVAVGAALAMASAANAEVSVYGKAHMSIDSLSDGDESSIYVSSNASRIGFKASEDIDGGLKAGFFAEQTIVMDGTGTTVFDRETYVSLGGGFGSFAVGKIDTPMKNLGRKVDFFGDQIGDARNLTGLGGEIFDIDLNADGDTKDTGESSSKNLGTDARPGNMITYTTPAMGGIGATVAFVPEDGTKDASIFDVGVNYSAGPIFAGFSYESQGKGNAPGYATLTKATLTGAAATARTAYLDDLDSQTAIRLAGSFTFGDAKVSALYQSVSNFANLKDVNQTTIGVGGSFKLGAGTVKAQAYIASEIDCKGTGCGDKTGATMIALGYDHSLSKNTQVYAAFAVTNNDDAGGYSMAGGGHGANPGVAVDSSGNSESPSGLSFGMVTKF